MTNIMIVDTDKNIATLLSCMIQEYCVGHDPIIITHDQLINAEADVESGNMKKVGLFIVGWTGGSSLNLIHLIRSKLPVAKIILTSLEVLTPEELKQADPNGLLEKSFEYDHFISRVGSFLPKPLEPIHRH